MALMRENSQKALSQLIDRYSDVLLRHISRRTGSAEDAAEILQDIFISLWNKRNVVEIKETIYPYLFSAAKYEIIDWMLSTKKKIAREQVLLLEEEHYDFPVEDVLMARELNDLLYVEVEKMPATMKAIFYMSREKSLSVKEIANLLSLSEQTVKNNLTMALKRLRLTLNQQQYTFVAVGILYALR